MTEKVASPAVAKTEVTKKATAKSAAKPRVKATHPKTAEMVNAAIASLKERSGSSLQAIKKYMAGTYMIDIEKQAPFIKKYLKSAVESGTITQTKGKGASGSFKLAAVKSKAAKPKAAKPTTPKKASATKKPAAKKTEGKKPATKTPAVGQKKKTTKDLAAKPPKPKTIKAKPAVKPAAKKAAKPAASPKKTRAVAAPKPKKTTPKKAVAKK